MSDYPSPVDRLLTLGEPKEHGVWPDYLSQHGLWPEHITELIRMATDPALSQADPDSREVWAPVYAWRALGQLHAEPAVGPLLTLLTDDDEFSDWVLEELPDVFGMMGPGIIPQLAAFLDDGAHGTYSRSAVGSALVRIAEAHPETRSECVTILSRQLERAEQNDPSLNGLLVGDLVALQAVEAAPLMERAFAAGVVDETITGDWPWVQFDLGLQDKPVGSRYGISLQSPGVLSPSPDSRSPKARAKARKKRKRAAKSRKRNRKRR